MGCMDGGPVTAPLVSKGVHFIIGFNQAFLKFGIFLTAENCENICKSFLIMFPDQTLTKKNAHLGFIFPKTIREDKSVNICLFIFFYIFPSFYSFNPSHGKNNIYTVTFVMIMTIFIKQN